MTARLCCALFTCLLLLAGCGGGGDGPDESLGSGSTRVKLLQADLLSVAPSESDQITIQVDGEVEGPGNPGEVDFAIHENGFVHSTGTLRRQTRSGNRTTYDDVTVQFGPLAAGEHELTVELDPDNRVPGQRDHATWAIKTVTVTVTGEDEPDPGDPPGLDETTVFFTHAVDGQLPPVAPGQLAEILATVDGRQPDQLRFDFGATSAVGDGNRMASPQNGDQWRATVPSGVAGTLYLRANAIYEDEGLLQSGVVSMTVTDDLPNDRFVVIDAELLDATGDLRPQFTDRDWSLIFTDNNNDDDLGNDTDDDKTMQSANVFYSFDSDELDRSAVANPSGDDWLASISLPTGAGSMHVRLDISYTDGSVASLQEQLPLRDFSYSDFARSQSMRVTRVAGPDADDSSFSVGLTTPIGLESNGRLTGLPVTFVDADRSDVQFLVGSGSTADRVAISYASTVDDRTQMTTVTYDYGSRAFSRVIYAERAAGVERLAITLLAQ